MAWTEFTRRRYERSGGKYASDATDAEWALVAPLMPLVRRTGRPWTTDLREVFDAILYIATTGCQWRMLPNDFPPVSTVRRYFYDWRDNGLLKELNYQLVAAARQAEGRAPGPSAGVIDSQSVKTTKSGSLRDELLNEEIFDTLDDARRKLALWRYDYNNVRPPSSLGNQTPADAR